MECARDRQGSRASAMLCCCAVILDLDIDNRQRFDIFLFLLLLQLFSLSRSFNLSYSYPIKAFTCTCTCTPTETLQTQDTYTWIYSKYNETSYFSLRTFTYVYRIPNIKSHMIFLVMFISVHIPHWRYRYIAQNHRHPNQQNMPYIPKNVACSFISSFYHTIYTKYGSQFDSGDIVTFMVSLTLTSHTI